MVNSEQLNNLPSNPGCYLYKNKYGKIIYVGKAKNLKNRVKSYFNGVQTGKTLMLVNEIYDLEFIVTKNELESLVLEYNLIKEHTPRYNIALKDDKSYPYIVITNEKYPKLIITRDKKLKKGKLYGPYPNSTAARETVELINRMYPLVKCRNIPKQECLYYHINQCVAPCIKDIDPKEYEKYIVEVKKILKGDISNIKQKLTTEMNKASEELNFEVALEMKSLLESIEVMKVKQAITINRNLNIDVINYDYKEDKLSIQLLYIRGGRIIERAGEIFDVVGDYEEIFIQYILNMYYEKVLPDEIVVPKLEEIELLRDVIPTSIVNYSRGDKSNYLKMAKENATIILDKYLEKTINEYNKYYYINEELKNIVGYDCYRIDMFDISHHAGVDTVGALVVSKDYRFDKNNYRKFKVKQDQNDDVASMKEVVYRYYFRVLMENMERPDLIVADGGKTQVNAIKEVVDSLNLNILVIGLIKDDKHMTESVLYNNEVIKLDKRSELFKYFTLLQDEVHRFAIGYHQTLASKKIGASKLDEISGVGSKRKTALIRHFKTIENIKNASLEQLEEVVPKNVAKVIFSYFQND